MLESTAIPSLTWSTEAAMDEARRGAMSSSGSAAAAAAAGSTRGTEGAFLGVG